MTNAVDIVENTFHRAIQKYGVPRLLDAAEKKFDERRREQQFGISYSALLNKKERELHCG